jgi:hypothetical protein
MKIRHLLILDAYAAIVLALMMAILRGRGQYQVAAVAVGPMYVCVLFAMLTAALLRPGPHRDWLTALFAILGGLSGIALLALPAVLGITYGSNLLKLADPAMWPLATSVACS